MESPISLVNLREICSFGAAGGGGSGGGGGGGGGGERFSLSALVLGSDDLLARLGGERTKTAEEIVFARQSLVAHARAFGLDPIDLVDIDFKGWREAT